MNTPFPRKTIPKKKSQRESSIEAYLVHRVHTIGGEAYKFVSPGRVGMPDRIVVLPGGEVIWCELKAPGGKVSPSQGRCHKRLRELTQEVKVLWSTSQIDRFFPIEKEEPGDNGC
jgi:hypothetical protein